MHAFIRVLNLTKKKKEGEGADRNFMLSKSFQTLVIRSKWLCKCVKVHPKCVFLSKNYKTQRQGNPIYETQTNFSYGFNFLPPYSKIVVTRLILNGIFDRGK